MIGELSREYERRNTLHTHIAARLYQTSKLQGFTGSLDFGKRIGRDSSINKGIPPPSWLRHLNPSSDANESGSCESEETAEYGGLHEIEDDSDAMAQLVDTLSL